MSYENVRDNGKHFPQPHISPLPWSRMSNMGASHQYTSLPSPHDQEMQPQYARSAHSTNSEFQYLNQNSSYSSRTDMLNQSTNTAYSYPDRSNRLAGNPWRPGFWTQFPWLGMLALLITVLATLACVVVLVRSQGVPLERWGGILQPTVYLSICTATANITLTYALYEGAVISFWRKAGQGATLRELHQYWHSGSSLWGAIRGVFQLRGKATAIACIMTVLSIGRGPLMQRASSVMNTVTREEGNLNILSAVRLPDGYAGRDTGRTSTPSFMNPNFTEIVQTYTNRGDINGIWTGCNSTCYASVKGIGFGVACNTSLIPYSIDPIIYPNGSATIIDPLQVFSADAWSIPVYNYSGSAGGPPYNYALLLNTTLLGTPSRTGNGSLNQNLCALRAGVVSYPIEINNDTITLQSDSWRNDTFLEDTGMLPLPYNDDSNIAGFILAAKGLYYGTATYQFGGGAGWILNLDGASANRYLQRTGPSSNEYDLSTNITWRDPMEDMVNSMREIAFRTSLQLAADNTSYVNASQTVPYVGVKPETVYTANYRYATGAVVLSLLGVFAVLPTYRGFWELGRTVTLSPLEVAKAFNAPLLNGVQGNQSAQEMLHELGGTKIRYGDTGVVVGELATGNYGRPEVVRRIEMGPVASIRPPEKDVRYV